LYARSFAQFLIRLASGRFLEVSMRLFELIKKILKNGSSVVLLFCILFSFIIFPSDLYAKKSYKRVLKSWTRQKEVYGRDDFYASMKWFDLSK